MSTQGTFRAKAPHELICLSYNKMSEFLGMDLVYMPKLQFSS